MTSENEKKTIVVFGGGGFLGSHVADHLSDLGHHVRIVDRQVSPYLREDQEMIQGDILDSEILEKALSNAEVVYNFCGMADIGECSSKPVEAVRVNILGHTRLLEACKNNNIERVFYSSSIYVYGSHGSFYRITKQTCEDLTEEYLSKYGLPYTILRYGSLFGPRAQKWNGVYRYIEQAIEENKIDYCGTGEERREYIHVIDAARLSASVMAEEYKNKRIVITGNNIYSSKELLLMIGEMLENQVDLNFECKDRPDHYRITPHTFIPKVGMKLEPNPSIDMGEGILRQIEEIYHEKNQSL